MSSRFPMKHSIPYPPQAREKQRLVEQLANLPLEVRAPGEEGTKSYYLPAWFVRKYNNIARHNNQIELEVIPPKLPTAAVEPKLDEKERNLN